MKQSTKAALLSGLVFPGAGHLYLKQYIRGAFFAGFSAVLLYFLVSVVLNTAFSVLEQVQQGQVPPDIEVITELVTKQTRETEESTNNAALVLLALWLVGIADSYRQGRRQEQSRGMSAKHQRGSQ